MRRNRPRDTEVSLRPLTDAVIGACIEVHRQLGPGLLEATYRACLMHELGLRGLSVRAEVPISVFYKGIDVQCGFRIDLLVEERLILELKCVDQINDMHKAQLLTYLRLADLPLGLLINFKNHRLVNGVCRVALNLREGSDDEVSF